MTQRRLLVTGASGQLGAYLLRELRASADVIAWSGTRTEPLFDVPLAPVSLTDRLAVGAAFCEARPDTIIHAAALSSVAGCFRNPAPAEAVNVGGTRLLTDLASSIGARLVFVSTDLVFDGSLAPYCEDNPPTPLSVYGRTKADAEAIVSGYPGGVVARVSLLFGPALIGRQSFFDEQVMALRTGSSCSLFRDEWRTPLNLLSAARALIALADSTVTGLLHIGGPERLWRWEMGQRLAAHLGSAGTGLVSMLRAEVSGPEPRPCDVSLDSTRFRELFPRLSWPRYEEALRNLEC